MSKQSNHNANIKNANKGLAFIHARARFLALSLIASVRRRSALSIVEA